MEFSMLSANTLFPNIAFHIGLASNWVIQIGEIPAEFFGVLAACPPPHSAMLQLLSSQFDNLNLSWMAIARWHGGALMGGWVENGGDGWGWGEGGWLLSADPIFSIMMITEMGKIRETPPSAFITQSVILDFYIPISLYISILWKTFKFKLF